MSNQAQMQTDFRPSPAVQSAIDTLERKRCQINPKNINYYKEQVKVIFIVFVIAGITISLTALSKSILFAGLSALTISAGVLYLWRLKRQQQAQDKALQAHHPFYINNIIQPLLTDINSNLTYQETQGRFEQLADTFKQRIGTWHLLGSQECFTGQVNDIDVAFGTLTIKPQDVEDKEDDTLLYYLATFKHAFNSNIILKSGFSATVSGLPKLKSRGFVSIRPTDQTINRAYRISCDNEFAAQDILTPDLLNKMVDIGKTLQGYWLIEGNKLLFLGNIDPSLGNKLPQPFALTLSHHIAEQATTSYQISKQLIGLTKML